MIDRWGNFVYAGWTEAEILWVRAALTLTPKARSAAFQDIASMRGCAPKTVAGMATTVRKQMQLEAAAEAQRETYSRRITIPERSQRRAPRLIPSDLKQPTQARLTGARA